MIWNVLESDTNRSHTAGKRLNNRGRNQLLLTRSVLSEALQIFNSSQRRQTFRLVTDVWNCEHKTVGCVTRISVRLLQILHLRIWGHCPCLYCFCCTLRVTESFLVAQFHLVARHHDRGQSWSDTVIFKVSCWFQFVGTRGIHPSKISRKLWVRFAGLMQRQRTSPRSMVVNQWRQHL